MSEGFSEVKKEKHLKFRTLEEFGTLSGLSELKGDEIVEFRTFEKFGTLRFHLPSVPVLVLLILFFSACGANLSDERAIELVRLNYKQQNSIEGAGTWLLDTVIIAETKKLPGDTCILVQANVSGLYKLPVMEDTPAETFERFKDTIQFKACKWGKIWKGDDWVIIGSTHE